MSKAVIKTTLSAEEYLEGEELAETRHEYVTGQVYAMAEAGERHNRIALNVAFQLRSKARGGHCGVFMSDMKLRIEGGERFYYPDVMLVCNESDDYYQRDEEGAWQLSELTSTDTILVECEDGAGILCVGLCLDDIYEDVTWR